MSKYLSKTLNFWHRAVRGQRGGRPYPEWGKVGTRSCRAWVTYKPLSDPGRTTRPWRRCEYDTGVTVLGEGERGRVRRLANVLDKLPKRLQPKAKRALREIMNAATRADAEVAITALTAEYQAKYPKAVASLDRDQEKRLTYFDFPAEHWVHLRTTNPVESPFSTVRLRQRVTKGAGSRAKGLVMAYKLLVMAEERWRKLNAPHLLPIVQAKVKFVDGIQQRKKEEERGEEAA